MKKKLRAGIVLLVLLLLLAVGQPAMARLGVGVNVGNIEVNETLLSGGLYKIATMSVINTGDEAGDYGVGVSYRSGQEELKPPEDWFRFSPAKFKLRPGQAKPVEISLIVPVNAKAGDYFALVEGHPIAKGKGLTVGIAAAAKMQFSIKSSSLFWSIYNRMASWFKTNAPYSFIGVLLVLLAVVTLIIRRYLRFSFRIERKGK